MRTCIEQNASRRHGDTDRERKRVIFHVSCTESVTREVCKLKTRRLLLLLLLLLLQRRHHESREASATDILLYSGEWHFARTVLFPLEQHVLRISGMNPSYSCVVMPGLSDDATGFIDRTLKISATGLSTIDPSIFYQRGAIGQC